MTLRFTPELILSRAKMNSMKKDIEKINRTDTKTKHNLPTNGENEIE